MSRKTQSPRPIPRLRKTLANLLVRREELTIGKDALGSALEQAAQRRVLGQAPRRTAVYRVIRDIELAPAAVSSTRARGARTLGLPKRRAERIA